MNYLPFLLHLVALMFWLRLWAQPSREFYFNPFLSGFSQLTDRILTFLRPVLAMPEQAAAAVMLLFTLLFKTLLLWRLALPPQIVCGSIFRFSLAAGSDSFGVLLAFNGLQLGFFLARLWTLHLLVHLLNPPQRHSRALEAMAFLARPCSQLPLMAQITGVLALHVLLVWGVTTLTFVAGGPEAGIPAGAPVAALAAAATSPFHSGAFPLRLVKLFWLAMLSMLDGIQVLVRTLMCFILASLATLLLRSNMLALISSEGIQLLLGRFGRSRASAMGLDFTPLIFYFVADLLYRSGGQLLYNLITNPLMN